MQTVRCKGFDFDLGGRKSTLEELVKVGGFMRLRDIHDRLPFPKSVLKAMYQRKGFFQFSRCFTRPLEDIGIKAMYVNIGLLNDLFDKHLENITVNA
jgi:hypothetical protein